MTYIRDYVRSPKPCKCRTKGKRLGIYLEAILILCGLSSASTTVISIISTEKNIQTNILSSSPITVETAKVEQEPSPTKKKWSWNTPTSFIVGVPILKWFLDSLEHIAHLCHPRTKKASKLLQHILPLRSNLHWMICWFNRNPHDESSNRRVHQRSGTWS